MIENIYEMPDVLAHKNIINNSSLGVFWELVRAYPELEKILYNDDIKIYEPTQDQLELLDKINESATKVMNKYGVSVKPSNESVKIFSMNMEGPNYDEDDEVLLHSFQYSNTGQIYIRDIDFVTEDGNADLNKLANIYTFQLAHRYGIPHEEMKNTDDLDEAQRFTGIYLSTYYGKNGQKHGDREYPVMRWLSDVAAIHIASEIKHEAGLLPSSAIDLSDWEEPLHEYTMKNFESLAKNLARYLKKPQNSDHLKTVQMLINPSNFNLAGCDTEIMKTFIIKAHLNRNLYYGLVYLLYSAYSQKLTDDKRYGNIWEEFLDDIGMFYGLKPQNFNL